MRGLLCLFAAALLAQAQSATHFEVASIKKSNTGNDQFLFRVAPGGTLTAQNVVANLLLAETFNREPFSIIGGPEWLDSERWSIDAKAEGITGQPTAEQLDSMILALLQDRFKLKFHREMQERPMYALVVSKGGSKLPVSEAEKLNIRVGRGSITLKKASVARLAELLQSRLGRTVIDKSGLTGEYDLALEWTPDRTEGAGVPGIRPAPDAPPPPDNGKPGLLTAIQEQLGLRLEPQRGPVEVIVIDHIERPSEN